MAQIDVSDAVRTFRGLHTDLTGAQFDKNVAGALNHTARKVRTRTSIEVRRLYRIKAKDVKKSISLGPAMVTNLTATIRISGKRLPIRAFPHRQTRKGVSVSILKGPRRVIHKAFVSSMGNGHQGVFARGEYKAKGFGFRYKRTAPSRGNDLGISELLTTSVPQAAARKIILQKQRRGVEADFPKRLSHLLGRASARVRS
jgi:hypothetical protein